MSFAVKLNDPLDSGTAFDDDHTFVIESNGALKITSPQAQVTYYAPGYWQIVRTHPGPVISPVRTGRGPLGSD